MILPTFYFPTPLFVGFRWGSRFDVTISLVVFVGSLSRSHGRTRPASNGSLFLRRGMSFQAPGVTVRTLSSRRAACSRHVVCFFRRFVCRVSIPAQKEKGAGFKTRGSAASVGRRLRAACLRVSLGYLMPLARDAIRARCNSLLGFFCERCEIGQRSFICFFHRLLGRFPRDRKAAHRR